MTTKEKKQAGFLGVLLAVLVGVWFFGYNRGGLTGSAKQVEAPPTKQAAVIVGNDARIRLDLIQSVDGGPGVGRSNPFAYRLPPPPPPPPVVVVAPTPRPPVVTVPPAPPAPPRLPDINLVYRGIATRIDQSGKKIATAVLFDNAGAHQVNEGDFLFGKYKIARITDTQVDVEDLEYNRKKTLDIQKQP